MADFTKKWHNHIITIIFIVIACAANEQTPVYVPSAK